MKKFFSRYSFLLAAVLFSSAGSLSAQDTKVSFNSTVQYGSQKNNIAVLVSPDFKGDYTLEGIKSATWIDVTKKFKFADNKEPFASGEVNISEAVKGKEKPLFFAVRYIGEASERPTQRGWGIHDLTFSGTPASGWKIVNDPKNHEGATWHLTKNGGVQFRSNQSLIRSESWAITPF